ncbi:ATP-dependent RNA helicase DDX51 [Osmia bicornis bicornis]|uniref:ATP-dependent RNA helicase DDX51 n=1 Tax=Osmia bicornis bicornis TaxID=1437191 RepID=UPI001EAEF726|nr:ATP-dependent RNA helicase DDX51 [Osmia bicornis bicornis]
MSLFVINRYEGEKEVETKTENKQLSELLKRIEERKKERVFKKENVQNVKEDDRKRKKRKIEISKQDPLENTSVNEDANQNNVETQLVHPEKLHKKKKKKKKNVHNIENNVNYEGTEGDNKGLQEAVVDDQKNMLLNKSADVNNVQEQSDFMVLGVKSKRKKYEVKRVLPEWLANPNIISNDLNDGPSIESLNSVLDAKLIQVLKANGIDKLFPVQASMITWLLKCNKDKQQGWWLRDTCVSAPTGSGKTLAYVLPIVHILQSRLVPKIRCIVVVPVQELAAQVYKVMVAYTSHTTLTVGLLSGACSFQQEQSNILRMNARGEYVPAVDIIVATPGRLIDHILKTPEFSLNDLRFLVIDEADRVADWLEYLPEPHNRAARLTLFDLRCGKAPVQKLLFSATLSQDPKKLNHLRLFQPVLFTSVVVSGKDTDVNLDMEVGNYIGRYTSPDGLTEYAVECIAEYKPVALYDLLNRNNKISKTLIFTNSGETAHRLSILLGSLLAEKNVTIGKLSAQLKPKEREHVLGKFITGEVKILISSDALARGVDIPDIHTVVSYDLPKHIKGYIHRAGRTGRAGKSGIVISILTSKQVGIFKDMLSNVHKAVPHIEKLELNSVADSIDYSSHVKKLKETLEEEKQRNLLRTKSVKRIQPIVKE